MSLHARGCIYTYEDIVLYIYQHFKSPAPVHNHSAVNVEGFLLKFGLMELLVWRRHRSSGYRDFLGVAEDKISWGWFMSL